MHGVHPKRVAEVVGEVDHVEADRDRDLEQRCRAPVERTSCIDDDITRLERRHQCLGPFDVDLSARWRQRCESPLAESLCNRGAEKACAPEQHDSPQANLRPITAAQGQKSRKSTPEQTATPRKLPAKVNALSPKPAAQMVHVQAENQPFSPRVPTVNTAPATV